MADEAPSGGAPGSPTSGREDPPHPWTKQEVEEFREVFCAFDRDGDRTVSVSELGAVLRELGHTPTREMVQEMIKDVDKDGTGSIDFSEFLELMARKTFGEIVDEQEHAVRAEDVAESPDIGAAPPPVGAPPPREVVTLLEEMVQTLQAPPVEREATRASVRTDADEVALTPEACAERLEELRVLNGEEAQALRELEGIAFLSKMESLLEAWRWELFEVEGWELVHQEEDSDRRRVPRDEDRVEADVDRMVSDLMGFDFEQEKDPRLAVGAEAFEMAARCFPFMMPAASLMRRLTDEAIRDEAGGVLDVTLSELGDQGACALAEVLQRDVLRPSHPDADIASDPLIRELCVARNNISPLGGCELLHALTTKTPEGTGTLITTLDMSHNLLGKKAAHLPRDARVLRRLAAQRQTLPQKAVSLTCGGRERCTSCAEWGRAQSAGAALKEVLIGPTAAAHLRLLRLTHNSLSDADCRLIAEGLMENRLLHELDLSHNCLGAQSGGALGDMIKDNTDLRVLKVSWNKLGSEGTTLLLRGLLETGTLEQIEMSHCGISDHPYDHVPGCARKCLSMRAPPRLVEGCNGDALDGGGKLLAKVLHAEGSLERVDASGNHIGAVGAWAIASALSKNSVMTSLDISHNPLTVYGVRKILWELTENGALEELHLASTLAGPSAKDGQAETELIRYVEDMRKRREERVGRKKPSSPLASEKSQAEGREGEGSGGPEPRSPPPPPGEMFRCPMHGVWPAPHTLWMGFPPRFGPPGRVTESEAVFEPDDLNMDCWRHKDKRLAHLWPAPAKGAAANRAPAASPVSPKAGKKR
eukprot:TRINITY_DN2857_c0_g1_i1.p1 TRINITY_DN2857_c0_g1~~TRINITY_DN2857_c0_g1_i1.p1  ORF type:complete len:818 (+),score=235.80 TRINITY_DN2857_c0_g1_i1:99-2552(+)